ncbi:hypothetical protein [Streptomyces sp. ISL-86]|uniref:hypothetical protein n=1 Tax=Streptomyces sp. ISL-86 TaxID=2819187 RepID=UPI001BE870EF|nr:hypothetical protein [Streptomyces sp. ISL-86]MBT2459558.1 hypothetical protein [Streptomyces sp. ISL-86]
MTLHSDQAVHALLRSADPGAVWAVGGPGGVGTGSADGDADLDVSGLAAVLALWPVIGSLVADGELALHTPLSAYGGAAGAGLPAGTTAHHLLTHTGGPPALTRLAEHLCGGTLAEYAAARIWHPLGMARTRFTAEGTLYAPRADLARFLSHLLSPADHPITRAWTAESLRIRTGELTPARGLLWHPGPHGVWCHPAPAGPAGPALWVSPRHGRWAYLLPAGPGPPLRAAFREAVFAGPSEREPSKIDVR